MDMKMRTIAILVVVGSLLLLPSYSNLAEGGGVGVLDSDPWISDTEIERTGNGYDVNFTVIHLNGVDSIYRINVEFIDWTNRVGRAFGIEFDRDETKYHGDVPEDIEITIGDTREDIDESLRVFMDVGISIEDEGYSRANIEVRDLGGDVVEKEINFPSLFSGRDLSLFSFPLIGALTVVTVMYRQGRGKDQDKKEKDMHQIKTESESEPENKNKKKEEKDDEN